MGYSDKDKQRAYQRDWLAKRKEDFYKDKSCAFCGSKNNLQIDHIDPKKKIDHKIWSWSDDRRIKELAKCQVLCQDCHKDKTRIDGSQAKKLTEQNVRDIKSDYATGKYSYVNMREKYNVSIGMISSIINGTKWKHVK